MPQITQNQNFQNQCTSKIYKQQQQQHKHKELKAYILYIVKAAIRSDNTRSEKQIESESNMCRWGCTTTDTVSPGLPIIVI